MTITDVMAGIETVLDTIDGLHASDVKPEQITPDAAIVGVPPISSYEEAFGRGKAMLQPTITVLTSTGLDRSGQLRLARYLSLSGQWSIHAALEADRTLGGAAEDAQLVSFRPMGIEDVGRFGYFGGVFVMRVMVRSL